MKRCPKCYQFYTNRTIKYCRVDGMTLVDDASVDADPTVTLPIPSQDIDPNTRPLQNIPSIAVLPLTNMSADVENEYFCDGLAEEILNALAKIDDLKVAARTSAFSFKGKAAHISEIGRVLNVGTVLEGSVRKSGNRIRITVQLINAADGFHLWSERYDRELKDIFDVQDEITLAVVEALKVKLLGRERASVLKRGTENTEAYELYLKGLHQSSKYTADGWRWAIGYFEQAIELEPRYAVAFAGKAYCLQCLHYYGLGFPGEIVGELLKATNQALALDEHVAEAHLALANYYFYYQRDWSNAEREFRRALELNPNSPEARQYFGLFLVSRGRFEEAIREGRKALELDPLSLVARLHVGWLYWFAGRFDKTLEQVERLIEIEPNFFGSYWMLGTLRSVQGNHEQAIEAFQKALSLGGTQIVLSYLGSAQGLAGNRDAALAIVDQLLEVRERQFTAAFNIYRVYSAIDEVDKTYEWLERSIAERNGELVYFRIVTTGVGAALWGQDFTKDPRYQNLLRRIEHPDELSATGSFLDPGKSS